MHAQNTVLHAGGAGRLRGSNNRCRPTMVRSIALRSVVTGALAALALLALPAQAQWKWRDAAGHVQYSDLPPPSGTPDKDILSRPAVQRRATAATLPASAASAAAAAS